MKKIKITCPALYYKPKKLLVKEQSNTTHAMLRDKLAQVLTEVMNIPLDRAEKIVFTSREIIDGFMTSEDKFVNRAQAWNIAKKYKERIKQYDIELKGYGGTRELATEFI